MPPSGPIPNVRPLSASVAQLDRASDYGSEGSWFNSMRMHQLLPRRLLRFCGSLSDKIPSPFLCHLQHGRGGQLETSKPPASHRNASPARSSRLRTFASSREPQSPLTSNPPQSSRSAPVNIGRGLVRSVSNVCCKPRQGRPGPPIGKRCEIPGVRRSGFFVLPPSLPVIPSLGEDAGEEGFAGFKGRVGTDCLRGRGLHLCLRAPDAG